MQAVIQTLFYGIEWRNPNFVGDLPAEDKGKVYSFEEEARRDQWVNDRFVYREAVAFNDNGLAKIKQIEQLEHRSIIRKG